MENMEKSKGCAGIWLLNKTIGIIFVAVARAIHYEYLGIGFRQKAIALYLLRGVSNKA